MGEVPGFSSEEPEITEEQMFIEAGYEPELIESSLGIYTIWSKIKSDKLTHDEPQNS
ncbi:hypothetical protein KC950_03220 [Candidatus Saccharibacteria bacterium]|nr:hypothetical protein [Candidatus Saccharibacteria bacterium]